MIRFFKASYLIQYVAILLAGLALWAGSFIAPPPMPGPEGFVPLYAYLFTLVDGHPLIQAALGFLVMIGSSIILNKLFSRHNIVQKNTSLAGFTFLILGSCYPEFLTVHPVNLAVFLILLVLDRLFTSSNKEEPLDILFSAGFLVAVASFIYFPIIFFSGYILVSLIIFRLVKWRDWLSSFIGLMVPFLYLATYYFWNDALLEKTIEYASMFSLGMHSGPFREPVYLILVLFITVTSLYALFYGIRNAVDKSIERTRKNLDVNWLILFAAGTIPFSSSLSRYHFILLAIPFSGVLAYYLMQVKKVFLQEMIFFVFILLVLINNLLFRWL